jgi:hypothetical protein
MFAKYLERNQYRILYLNQNSFLNIKFDKNLKFCKFFTTTTSTTQENISNKKTEFVNKYSSSLSQLQDFKLIMYKLLEEKKFHYSVLDQPVTELISLSRITKSHTKILSELIKNYNLNYSENRSLFIDEKMCYINASSVLMSYQAFLELLKYLHERKEEDLNNIIREIIEHDYQDEILNKNIVILRDEWRDAFQPEILDENSKPIIQLNALDRINLEINKRLYDYIL